MAVELSTASAAKLARSGFACSSIVRSVERMTRMIERVLFIGRTDAELLDFAPRELDLAALCREAVAEAQQEFPAALPLALELPAELRGAFDEKLLRHVLGNLLSNALKYSRDSARKRAYGISAISLRPRARTKAPGP